MNCDEALSEFLDRDLSLQDVEAAVRVAEHLRECPTCRQVALLHHGIRKSLKRQDKGDWADESLSLPGLELPQTAPPKRRKIGVTANLALQTALAVIAVIGWGLYWRHRAENRPAPQVAAGENTTAPHADNVSPRAAVVPVSLAWTPAEVDRGAALFSKVSESFEGRAAWVALGDGASDVGLLDGPAVPPPKVLLVRLAMSQDDRSPSKTDLVIVPGQEVRVEVPFQAGEVLRYRIKTTAGEKPRLTLAAEVRSLARGETLAALATELQPQPGEALSAGRLLSSSGPFHLDVSFSETAL